MADRPTRRRSWQSLLLIVLGLTAALGALTLGALGGTALSSVVPVAAAPDPSTDVVAVRGR